MLFSSPLSETACGTAIRAIPVDPSYFHHPGLLFPPSTDVFGTAVHVVSADFSSSALLSRPLIFFLSSFSLFLSPFLPGRNFLTRADYIRFSMFHNMKLSANTMQAYCDHSSRRTVRFLLLLSPPWLTRQIYRPPGSILTLVHDIHRLHSGPCPSAIPYTFPPLLGRANPSSKSTSPGILGESLNGYRTALRESWGGKILHIRGNQRRDIDSG